MMIFVIIEPVHGGTELSGLLTVAVLVFSFTNLSLLTINCSLFIAELLDSWRLWHCMDGISE